MMKARVYYILWIIFLLIANVFINTAGAFILLVLTIMITLLSLFIYLFTSPKISIIVKFPENTDKKKTAHGNIQVINKRYLPYVRIKFTLYGENLLTGEKVEFPVQVSVPSFGKIDIPVKIKDDFCGKIDFSATDMKIYDVFLLTYRSKSCEVKGNMLVLPDWISSDIRINNANHTDLEATDYSDSKSGFDMSEPFGYREYIQGDSPKSINWKLTQKLDNLIVREGGNPVSRLVLILLNTGVSNQDELPEYKVIDTMIEVNVALSRILLANGIAHGMAWQDQKSNEFNIYEINSEDDLADIILKLLSLQIKVDEISCLEHYMKNCKDHDFSNILCVSPVVPPSELLQYQRTTVLLVEKEKTQEVYEDGKAEIIPFSSDSMKTDLLNIRI